MTTRPPPIPRRHPSRPSLSGRITPSSPGASNTSLPLRDASPPPPLPTPPSTALELASSRPSSRGANGNRARPSTLLIGSSQNSAHPHGQSAQNTSPNGLPASPSIGRRGPGAVGLGAASAVGLGPARIDFKDWVKAGRDGASASPEEEQRHGHATHHRLSPTHNTEATTSYNSFSPSTRRQKEPSPAFSTSSTSGAENDVVRRSGRSGVHRHYHRHTSSSGTTTPPNRPESSTAQKLLRSSSMASSHSMGSLSIDSSRSPQGMPSRITERLNAVATEARLLSHSTPRRLSHDMNRELNTSTNSRASRGSRQLSIHSPSFGSPGSPSGDRRYSAPAVASPLERRFSRRLATRDSAGTPPRVNEEAVEVLSPRHDSSLDDRIHEAEAKLARSSSTRNVPNADERTSPLRRFHSATHSRSESGHFTPARRDRPNGNNYGPESGDYDRREYGSGGRLPKTRNPIPSEFQNGRGLFTPPPKSEEPRRRLSHLVDLGDSPRSPRGSFDLVRSPRGSSFDAGRSERSFTTARPASVMETSREPRGGWGRPSSVMAHPLSRAEFDQFNSPIGRRRDLSSLSNGRPESVLETSADHHRYNTHGPSSNRFSNYSHDGYGGSNRHSGYDRHSQYSTDVPSRYSTYSSDRQSFYSQDGGSNRLSALAERDTQLRRDSHVRDSNSRIGPNDSVSVVGNGSRNDPPNSARKDPLELIRKLEETRVQTKQRWDEDRSASVMSVRNDDAHPSRYAGDREVLSGGRASSRMDDTRVPSRANAGSRLGGPRPSSSMSSVRDGYAPNSAPRAAPNTAPVTRRRTNSDEHSLLDSPLIGRSSRASVLSTEPSRVLRSQMTHRSQTSSDQPITEHGRLLVDAVRMAESRLGETNPELVVKLDAAAQGAERANAGVRAAAAIASELVIDVEVDDAAAVATVRDRLPRLSVTLREAGRMSDRAVRDLTDALLAVRGGASTPSRGPLSSQGTGGDPAHRRAWSQTLDGRETPSSRHSTSLSSASMQSPLLRYRDRELHPRETTPVRHEASSSVASSRYDPLPSATSVTSGGSSRFEGGFPTSRTLDPIEQSPPKPMSRQSPKTVTRSNTMNALSTSLQASEDWAKGTLVSPNVSAEMEDESESEPEPDTDGYVIPEPEGRSTPRERPPRAPERGSPAEHGLRKQSSLASTHTVRGNSFIPSQSEPTTALTSSTAYSTQLSHAHADSPNAAQVHARRISGGSAVSGVSAAAALTERALADRPTSLHRDSILSVGSQYSTGTSPERDAERGTFGAAEGARIRASVSERFRKHLSGGD